MKTPTLIIAAVAAFSVNASIRTIELFDGVNNISQQTLPSRSADIVAFETIMAATNTNGSATLMLGRTATMKVDQEDVVTSYSTQSIVSVKTLANNYTVAANYYGEEGAMADVQVSTFSNCYASTSKGMNHGEKGTSRITFTPGSGTMTTVYPTNYTVRAEFFGNYWYTNFVWNANSTTITVSSDPSVHPFYRINLSRRLPPTEILQTNDVEIVTSVTNRWVDTVTRTVEIPLASTQTTNGYVYSVIDTKHPLFAGDRLICHSPISTNAAGKVRVIIRD